MSIVGQQISNWKKIIEKKNQRLGLRVEWILDALAVNEISAHQILL